MHKNNTPLVPWVCYLFAHYYERFSVYASHVRYTAAIGQAPHPPRSSYSVMEQT